MELVPLVELVPNVNQITHRIELELELMPKNHENLSPDLDPALELIQPYFAVLSPGCPSPTDSEVKRNLSSELDSTTPPWPRGEAGFEEDPLAAWAGISLLLD